MDSCPSPHCTLGYPFLLAEEADVPGHGQNKATRSYTMPQLSSTIESVVSEADAESNMSTFQVDFELSPAFGHNEGKLRRRPLRSPNQAAHLA